MKTKTNKAKEEMTCIRVRKSTSQKLMELGKMGDTYDAVISRLLNGRKPIEKEKPQGDE